MGVCEKYFSHGVIGTSPGIFWYHTWVLYTTTVSDPDLIVTNPSASGFTYPTYEYYCPPGVLQNVIQ